MMRVWLLLCLGLCLVACNGEKVLTPAGTPPPTALPTFTPVPSPMPGGLYVDAGQPLGPISPFVYGSNYGPWVAVPAAMLPQAFESGVTIFRFPAGAWGDNNSLKNYQIDQFMTFIAQFGATASISVRLKESTPEIAAEWVRYVNLEKGYNIRYWSIGNEPTLYADELAEGYDTARFNQEWRAIAQAMKAVDPSILLLGPELHQFTADPAANPKDSSGRDWMTEFLRANGDLVDIIAIHRYPFPRNQANATIPDLRQNAREWDQIIPYLRQLIRNETGRDLPIAVTEFNSHYSKAISGEATPDSHYNAIWLADSLGRMIRNGVFMVNHWMLTSQGGQGGWGLIGTSALRPSYYVYQLYQQFGTELFYSSSDDEDVTVYASGRDDGTLTILLINLKSEAVNTTLTLANGQSGNAQTWLFDASHPASQLEPTTITPTTSLTLPAESVTLFQLPK